MGGLGVSKSLNTPGAVKHQMQNSTQDVAKHCPGCRRTDITSFKTCRYCHTKYDAVITHTEYGDGGIGFKVQLGAALFVGLLAVLYFGKNTLEDRRVKYMAPVVASVKAAHRPRVIEFYSKHCPACLEYEPKIEAVQARYQGRVDFERLNLADQASFEKRRAMLVQAIPRTCIFDSNGNEIFDFEGVVDEGQLSKILDKI
jgi:thiol-disulfide isomerase/thioredoxin